MYYDYQVLLIQKYGGISRYFFELASRLPDYGADVKISCLHSKNYYFRDMLGLSELSTSRIYRGLERRIYSRLNNAKTYIDLMRNYDIIHPTYYDPYIIGHYNGRLVVTVHDMIHEKYRDTYFSQDKVTVGQKDKMIHSADRIIAISENTKHDLLYYYPDINPDIVDVIYHGASMKPLSTENSPMPKHDYILFVGSRGGYKNFLRFIEAVKPIMNIHKELHIFCAGGGEFKPEELELFGEHKSRIHQAGLSDSELSGAYSGALCFVFPSEYEGFGIPILEAFACGCPVVCSNASSFPEVAGDAAEYFDPLNVDDMSAKILKVIDDKSIRDKMKSSGHERLKLFDWDNTAHETYECYRRALE